MTAMNSGLEILPLREYALVRLHLWSGLGPLEAITLELTNQIVEDERVGTLAAIFWQYAYQQQVDGIGVVPFQRLEQFPPAKGQESTVASALQGA